MRKSGSANQLFRIVFAFFPFKPIMAVKPKRQQKTIFDRIKNIYFMSKKPNKKLQDTVSKVHHLIKIIAFKPS